MRVFDVFDHLFESGRSAESQPLLLLRLPLLRETSRPEISLALLVEVTSSTGDLLRLFIHSVHPDLRSSLIDQFILSILFSILLTGCLSNWLRCVIGVLEGVHILTDHVSQILIHGLRRSSLAIWYWRRLYCRASHVSAVQAVRDWQRIRL